jgi:hypothetical protein
MINHGTIPRVRRHLNADALIQLLRERFRDVPDKRRSPEYSMVDTLTAAFAMFSLKEPSLLNFEKRAGAEEGIGRLYGIDRVPCDSTMREILDGIDIEPLNEAFADLFHELQRSGMLKKWVFDEGHYLLAIDGTGHFCSSTIHCPHCLEKKSRNGTIQYHHQAVAAVLTHPETREVIPLAIEPIIKQDGETKNDCERNATARLLRRIRRLYPKLKLIVVEDGLSSNAPHIADLKQHNMHYLLIAKPSDHQHLFDQVIEACDESREESVLLKGPGGTIVGETQVIRDLELNKSNPDVRVNFLQHFEYDATTGDVVRQFSWVTDMTVPREKLMLYQRAGRSRWRIENETFNTLKNQGYHYDHNYGHGKENLSTVLMLLMFLAFLIDQIQQACCPLFQEVLEKLESRRSLWDHLRSHVRHFSFGSFRELWAAVLTGSAINCRAPPHGG